MQERMNRMFGSAFERFEDSDDFAHLFDASSFSPNVNIEDQGDHYRVTVDLPGAEDSELDIRVNGRTLTVSGKVDTESRDESTGSLLRRERRSGHFERSVVLPEPVDSTLMTTRHEDGVLTIELPKAFDADRAT